MASNSHSPMKRNDGSDNLRQRFSALINKSGIHSGIALRAAGFDRMVDDTKAMCSACDLQISDWPPDITPFQLHAQRSSTCAFVRQLLPTPPISMPTSSSNEKPTEHHFVESAFLKQARLRTFSHWPSHMMAASTQMIAAGFFSCRVNDRVICIYCDLICQQWAPEIDDPCQVHRTMSPDCVYVCSILDRPVSSSPVIVNASGEEASSFDRGASVHSVCHPDYTEIPRRTATFATWSPENLPSVDALVRAGFFYSGSKTIVTCFYCNGSLQNWGANDDPMIEHARWFPHCVYARQLCGDHLYHRIQEAKRRQRQDESTSRLRTIEDGLLSRMVSARLDLAVSQRLLDQSFKLSVIKRCWEDQLRLNGEDFTEDIDLWLACTILQKQIARIGGKKENIVIPSVAMSKKMPTHQTETSPDATNSNDGTETANESNKEAASSSPDQTKKRTKTAEVDLCVLCLTDERKLACIPCGHVATCVPCGHSLRFCPICRHAINSFMRIYL